MANDHGGPAAAAASPAAASVGELLETLRHEGGFRMVAGGVRGFERSVRRRQVQRLGVAMTGYVVHLDHDRVQVLGRSESGFLGTLPAEERHRLLSLVLGAGFPALAMTCGYEPDDLLCTLCDQHGCALITTDLESTLATERLNLALGAHLAPRVGRHAVLVDVYGVGVLIMGPSGIGKSEVGLELVTRGHRLVADDFVNVEQTDDHTVVGSCPELTRHHMEIRGLGVINVQDLFGAASVRDRKRIEIVVELTEWSHDADYERLGLDTRHMDLVGVPVQHVVLPARPGRSMSILIEVAARNHLLRLGGTHSAETFARRLEEHLVERGPRRRVAPDTAERRSE